MDPDECPGKLRWHAYGTPWFILMEGASTPMIQMDGSDGWFRWFIRMVHSDGAYGWCIRMVQMDGSDGSEGTTFSEVCVRASPVRKVKLVEDSSERVNS